MRLLIFVIHIVPKAKTWKARALSGDHFQHPKQLGRFAGRGQFGHKRCVYEVDRSAIVWSPKQRQAVAAKAPDWIIRILTTACETGLRVGDLIRLSRSHIEETPKGRRIRVRTNKRNRAATIPVSRK